MAAYVLVSGGWLGGWSVICALHVAAAKEDVPQVASAKATPSINASSGVIRYLLEVALILESNLLACL